MSRRDEDGQTALLIVGFFVVAVLLVIVVVDASAAYLRRQQLDALADGAALAAADGIQGAQVYEQGLGDRAAIDPGLARTYVADYLSRMGAQRDHPGLVPEVQVHGDSVEVVVRGYLAGTTSTSVLTKYRNGERDMYGIRLPDGLRDNEKLPQPIITPTSKAFDGGHDEPLSGAEILAQGLLTAEQWETVSRYALSLFARGQARAAERGLILVDTKYEFGTDKDGRIVLADEIHTPDSSRYWIADSYEESFAKGGRPASFDKDFVRAWVTERCDPYKDPIPEIPRELVEQTSKVYIQAFEQIPGKTFMPDLSGATVLDRIRKNLAPYFA